MLGFYNYTVILTYLGMLISFAGITCILNGDVHTALICLMLSGVCDMFDGKIASTRKRTVQEKRFGIQIDSLSDLICFGAFPAIVIYITSEKSNAGFCISCIYLLCTLIRLAYFNVDEEERQNQTQGSREIYQGLPVTTAALMIPALFITERFWNWPLRTVGPAALLVMSIAFLTPFRLKKPKLWGQIILLILGIAELLFILVG
ncbi:MAG: CDP-alcohol phosphatidyltransferase family protein [Lachnospiraceae bacterium]